jgi:hypothetical protein
MDEISELFVFDLEITEKVNQPPTVSITFPLANDQVAGRVKIFGTADDKDSKIESVEVKIDDSAWGRASVVNSVGTSIEWEYEWDSEDVDDGDHTITVRSYDGKKHSAEQSIVVNVNNRPTTYITVTVSLNPEETLPNEDVKVSGTAKYDTNVPVKNEMVKIEIIQSGQSWTTETNSQGKYSHTITAPNDPGTYTVSVLVNDGTLQHSNSEQLTVNAPPDLFIDENDITITSTSEKITEKDRVKITAMVHNDGDLSAKCTVSIYLDSTAKSAIHSASINIPAHGQASTSYTWVAREGRYNIIVVVSDSDPEEADDSNNRASTEIVVASATSTADEEGGDWLSSLSNMPILYTYLIIIAILGIIILVVIAIMVKTVRSKKRTQAKTAETRLGRVRGGPMTVEFKPVDKEKTKRSAVPIVMLIFAILAMILLIASLFMPWYISSIGTGAESMDTTYSFDGLDIDNPFTGETEHVAWDDELAEPLEATSGLYDMTQILVLVGAVMCILMLIGSIISMKGRWKAIAVIFGLLAFISCLAAPIYFYSEHPDALISDQESDLEDGPHVSFMGSATEETFDLVYSWGPGMGWFLAIGGIVFSLLGFIASLAIPKRQTTRAPKPLPGRPRPSGSGLVVFQPLDGKDRESSAKAASESAIVKFESIDS